MFVQLQNLHFEQIFDGFEARFSIYLKKYKVHFNFHFLVFLLPYLYNISFHTTFYEDQSTGQP